MNIEKRKECSYLCELFKGSKSHTFDITMNIANTQGVTVALIQNEHKKNTVLVRILNDLTILNVKFSLKNNNVEKL